VKSPYEAQASGFKNTQLLPQRLLGGGTASLSPFRRPPRFHRGSLPPLLGLAPCDREDIPPRLPQLICGKPQISKSCSVSGFALLSCGEEPCLLSLQTVFHPLAFADNLYNRWGKSACSKPQHVTLIKECGIFSQFLS